MRNVFSVSFISGLALFLTSTWSYAALNNIAPNTIDESSIPQTTDQGWSLEDRKQFYYTSGGSILLPCRWFLALEQKDNTDLFVAPHNIAQLHLAPNILEKRMMKDSPVKLRCDESRLPVGIAITDLKDTAPNEQYRKLGKRWVGLTCAFCHTGELHYTAPLSNATEQEPPDKKIHYTLYVDGGPSMQSNFRFLRELVGSLRATLAEGEKFSRFANRIYQMCQSDHDPTEICPNNPEFHEHLRQSVTERTFKLLSNAQIDVVEWGFGRFDALGRGSNLVFANLDQDNFRHANAPVSIPPLWYAWRYDVVQWSGLIRHPIARNIGQTIAVGAGLFDFPATEPFNPNMAFHSTTDIGNIIKLENLVRKLKPPDWPGIVLGEIKPDVAMAGKQLYGDLCKGCHHPTRIEHPTQAQLDRGQTLQAKIIPRLPDNAIGTDPTYLVNASTRYVSTVNESEEKDFSSLFKGQTFLPMPEAIKLVTDKLLDEAKRDGSLAFPFDDFSDNKWETPRSPENGLPIKGYMARPLVGIWATPPYLHNGSVPTLYDLLSPSKLPAKVLKSPQKNVDKHVRPECFLTGDLEFDPINVGYRASQCDVRNRPDNIYSGFNFWTTRPGNSNAGHEFTDYDKDGRPFSSDECKKLKKNARDGILGCALNDIQRRAIIEYLKTCDLDDQFEWDDSAQKPWDPTAPPKLYCRNDRYKPVYRLE